MPDFVSIDAAELDRLLREVEECRRKEAAARESERRYREALETMKLMAVILDRSGTVTFCNDAFLAATGWQAEEVLAGNWFELFAPWGDDEVQLFLESVISGRLSLHDEHDILTNNGESRLVSWSNTFLRDSSGAIEGIVRIGQDITEQRRFERQMRQAQKMESVGTLAGGIAHDFNNILTAIIGYGHLLEGKVGNDQLMSQYVNQILAAADRAASLTSRLLAFSRKQFIQLRPVNLNEVIRSTQKLLRRLVSEDVEFVLQLCADELVVNADSTQIDQVLMNLVSNAADAMPCGGTLVIETKEAEMDAELCHSLGYGLPGKYAMIVVTDTGSGMEEAVRQRIFEPFFTTKEVGKGTGLGLSMVYGIVKQHNGYIGVESEPGEGTTFRIYLPLSKAAVAGRRCEEKHVHAAGTETILVAEDEPMARELITVVLTEAGYTVVAAGDGQEAVEAFAANCMDIELVVLDVVMPKKNGKAAYDEMRSIRSGVKALFISGYAPDVIRGKGMIDEGVRFVAKPVTPQDLLKAVRGALDT